MKPSTENHEQFVGISESQFSIHHGLMGFNGILMGFNGIYDGYPLVNCYITIENHHSING